MNPVVSPRTQQAQVSVRPNHQNCRICGKMLPPPFLDLGAMPLANAFLASPQEFDNEARYPLAVCACTACELVQLNHVVPADQLYRNYIYVSSTSEAVRAHADTLADQLIRRYDWQASSLIVEVASNDGTVLKAFQSRGVRVLGVEPAKNIAALAQADGIPTVAEFFNEATARDLLAQYGQASGIIARHVFAHVDDVHGFLEGARHVLRPDGVLIIEAPYFGDLLQQREFDTIYHEHLSYLAFRPMQRLCDLHGLRIIHVDRIGLHGGSAIFHIVRSEQKVARSASLEEFLLQEERDQITSPERLGLFVREVQAWKSQFTELLQSIDRSGGVLAGYGAAAKANTLLNYCPEAAQLLRCLFDRSPHKQGRYTPGTHLRVEPVDRWQAQGVTHLVLLAWNFTDEIMRQMQPFAHSGGRFVQVLPRPGILS